MNKAERLEWLKEWYETNKAALQSQAAMVSAIKSNYRVEACIRDLYLQIYMKTLGGCGNCLADALIQLILFSKKSMAEIIECKFKLRAGVLLIDHNGVLPQATNTNLTDAIAIAYLKDNPARKDMFEVLPDNVDELICGEVEEEIVEEATETPATAKKSKKK